MREKRRLLSPAFAISYLNGLEPLFQDCIGALVEVLTTKCSNSEEEFATVDIDRVLGNVGADVMSASLFGGSFGVRNCLFLRLELSFSPELLLIHICKT